MRILGHMIRGFTSVLVFVLVLTAAQCFIFGLWLPGLVLLVVATLLAVWLWRSANRALADEGLQAAEKYDAAEPDA